MKASNSSRLAAVSLLVALVLMSIVLPAAAQSPRPMRHFTAEGGPQPERLSAVEVSEIAEQAARTPDGLIKVTVTLAGEPAVRAYIAAGARGNRSAASSAAEAAKAAIRTEQSVFEGSARGIGASVLSSTQYATNTVTLAVTRDQLARLRLIPGVVAVHPVRVLERQHTTSLPLIGVPSVWDSDFSGGYTGEGVTIAIIDSGIDYSHLHFGGTGDYENPDEWPPNTLPSAIGEQKIIGGYDFVGDDYDAAADDGSPALIPNPDPDPLDCHTSLGGGHGTHVAGTAAGYGVVPDGLGGYETYDGSYDTGSDMFPEYPSADLTNWLIGPGVAPGAYLVALRVFGCSGSTGTDVLLDALDAAGDDFLFEDVDVINMSIGSAYGGASNDDPLIYAQENLIDSGIVIVDSAGNNGNFTHVSGAPGSAPSVINVASVTSGSALLDTLVELTSGGDLGAEFAATNSVFGLQDYTGFEGELIVATPLDGCEPLTGGPYTDLIVIVDRGVCEFSQKANSAYEAGAAGVIIANNAPGLPIVPGNGTVEPADPGVETIPVVMVSQASGTVLKANAGETVELSTGVLSVASDTPNHIVSTSSRGGVPRGADDLVFKPNVTAPGDSIASAGSGLGSQPNVFGGTSMASPHVAGVAALLLDREDLPPNEIKAAIMNTANPGVVMASFPGTAIQPPQRVGAGLVQADLAAALLGETRAYAADAESSVTVSFGYPKVLAGSTYTETKDIAVRNNTGSSVTWHVSLIQRSDAGGSDIRFELEDTTHTVPGGGAVPFEVELIANPHVSNINTNSYAFDTAGGTFLTEESALVLFEDAAGILPDMVVPVYAAPHATSDMTATLSEWETFANFSLELDGTEIWTGGTGTGANMSSMVSVLEYVASDPDDAPENYTPRPNDNYPQVDAEGADIAAIGITTDYAADPTNPFASIYFGVVTHGEWTTPKEVLWVFNIDADRDGEADYQIYNSFGVNNAYQSVFADINDYIGNGSDAAYTDTSLNGVAGASLDTMLFKNNVVVLPFTFAFWNTVVPAGKAITGEFDYWVETVNRDGDFEVVIDKVGSAEAPFSFNPYNAALSFSDLNGEDGGPYAGAPLWFDWAGFAVPVNVNPNYEGDIPDILALHHHNHDIADRHQIIDTSVIAPPAGDAFNLLTPANNSYIRDGEAISEFTWESVGDENTQVWRVVLTHLSTNTRLGEVFDWDFMTSADDMDPLTCADGECVLDVTGLALADGLYSWTVASYGFGEVEAANGPFYFTIESNDINLLTNPGFEDCASGNAAGWGGAAKCKNNANKASSGNGFLKAGVKKFANQNISHAALDTLDVGDVLIAGGYFKTKANSKVVMKVTVKYDDNTAGVKGKGKDVIKLTSNTATGGAYAEISDGLILDGTVKSIKVKVGSGAKAISADDLYVTVAGIAGPELRGGDVIPPPAAPDGFRGNN